MDRDPRTPETFPTSYNSWRIPMFLLAQFDSWMLLGGMSLLIYLLVRRKTLRNVRRREKPTARKTYPGKASHPLPQHDACSPSLPLHDAPPEILRWHVEMHDLARDLKGELDTKMVALRALLRMAQDERRRLETLLARLESHTKDA